MFLVMESWVNLNLLSHTEKQKAGGNFFFFLKLCLNTLEINKVVENLPGQDLGGRLNFQVVGPACEATFTQGASADSRKGT